MFIEHVRCIEDYGYDAHPMAGSRSSKGRFDLNQVKFLSNQYEIRANKAKVTDTVEDTFEAADTEHQLKLH